MIELLLKTALVNFIKQRIKKRMFSKLKKLVAGAGITGLIVGVVSAVSGVDLAPQDVDVLVTAASILATLGPKVYDGVKAKWFSKE